MNWLTVKILGFLEPHTKYIFDLKYLRIACTCILFKYNVRRLWIIYFHTTFQDPDASFDVNSHDKDPQPHYDYTNENRWRQFLLWLKNWKHEGHSEQSASSCPQNAKVQLIFSWIEVEIIISTYISQKWKCQFDHGWQDRNIKVRNDSCLWCLPHCRLTIIMSG